MTNARMSPRTGTVSRVARETVLTLGAILGIVCLAWTVTVPVFHLKPLVFMSGSMSPTIKTGDLAFAKSRPADQLKVDDIVSVPTASGTRVTHRIVEVTIEDNKAQLTLKGDANNVPDAETYTVKSADRVFFQVPKAGYVIDAIGSRAGLMVSGAVVMLLIFLGFGSSGGGNSPTSDEPTKKPKGGKRKAPGGRKAGALMAAAVAAVFGASVLSPQIALTLAGFNDTGEVRSDAISAYTVPAPDLNKCTGDWGLLIGSSVKFTWAAVPGATSYTVYRDDGYSATQTGTSKTFTSGLLGTGTWKVTVVANRDFGSTTWSSVKSNQRTFTMFLGTIPTCA